MCRFLILIIVFFLTGAQVKACDEDDFTVKPDFRIHKPCMSALDSVNYCNKNDT